jgi:uncharacterized NAD(P)/FAD-binding protein YdhS
VKNAPSIAIIGGGFSGAAVAFHLARARVRADTIVFEPRARLGGGLAYGGDDPIHRVNVPATRMSIIPEDGEHFARWLAASGALAWDNAAHAGGEVYPRRSEFGRYVEETLRPWVVAGAVRHVRASVVSMRKAADGWRLRTEDGQTFRTELAAIATTHPAPALPPQLRAFDGDSRLIADPLVDNVVQGLAPHERVLIVGAGLTAADLVAALDARAHLGPITMISRRGLRARGRSLSSFAPEGDFLHPPSGAASDLLARVRAAVSAAERGGRSWQAVIEGVRNQGQDIWRALDVDARRRIVRHLRPFWDAHRFRAAPQIEAIVDRKLKQGTLALKRAHLGFVSRDHAGFAVELRDGRTGGCEIGIFDRIIVAVGPAHQDILRSQAFLAELGEAGIAATDATKLGLWTTREGRAIGADGAPNPTLFIAGPLARGAFGELMGLPQVSVYAQFIANQIVSALSVLERREKTPARV